MHIPTCESAKKWAHLSDIADEIQPYKDCEIGLLIGYNCPRAMAPKQVILGGDDEPFAIRTDLGWSVVGRSPAMDSPPLTSLCHRISVKEVPLVTPADVIRVLESDFKDGRDDSKTVSQDYVMFLNKLGCGIQKNTEGHYEMPLPFKRRPSLPDNKNLAILRLNHLKRKLSKDQKYKEHYVKFMEDVISKGDEEVHDIGLEDFLRFLWWSNGDFSTEPKEFRMRVHLFGAFSSPGCANYGLKYLAKENKDQYPLGAQFVTRDFYVDDGVVSVNVENAIQVAREARDLCANGGLRLHKFVSNDRAVLESIPPSERSADVGNLDLAFDDLPLERALGVQWDPQSDHFKFSGSLKEQPATRRGVLSTVASLYDPLGFVAPFVLNGKMILQEKCRWGTGWDDNMGDELQPKWERWRKDLAILNQVTIPRSYTPVGFDKLNDASLQAFLYEAMAIVNSRPLTVDNLTDPDSLEPLTPNHLLTQKSNKALPPPGEFIREDMYGRKRWRHVQYLAEQFWSRWRKEYLATIATRQRWHSPRRNVQPGDIVMLRDDNLPRYEWRLGRVSETTPDKDGLVRRVRVQLGDRHLGKKGERLSKLSVVEWPVQKLILLLETS
ncbi:hypothetical protein SRHO_G00034670 [Serrasalmus rhombeus]